jgi:hypothetical protein
MRHHKPAGGVEIVLVAQPAREPLLFIRGQHRNPIDGLDVRIDASKTSRA